MLLATRHSQALFQQSSGASEISLLAHRVPQGAHAPGDTKRSAKLTGQGERLLLQAHRAFVVSLLVCHKPQVAECGTHALFMAHLPIRAYGLFVQRDPTFLSHLVQEPDLVESWILPFLEEARHTEDWYVAHRHDAEDGSFSLQVFVWPPGTGTKIHDHSSWGAYCCAVGSVLEERYERLDDGSRPEYARLKKVWQL